MKLANRVAALTPSSTLAITAKAKELKAAGHDVIGLGAGEPDFNTPDYIIEAAVKAMREGHTKYTPSAGLPALKQAICKKLLDDQQLEYKPNEVIVGSGAKFVLYALFQVLLNKDDEVIIPTPYWVSYPEQVKLAEGVPVYVEGKEENNFKITVDQLEAAITDKTVALILNSPSNPTGMLYSKEELQAIGELCVKHNIWIVSDEIYEKLVYFGATHTSIAQVGEEVKARTIIINGHSKSHSMTGWRIGYAAGSQEIIKSMTDLSSHSISNPTSVAQYAALAAYEGDQGPVETMRQAFEQRLEVIYDKLIAIPGMSCIKPQGAFYLFPNAKKSAELSGYNNVDDFAKALLEEALVAVVPGSGFGAPENLRLSYATSLDLLEEAITRIRKFVEEKM
ncbi:pyridoxal phosphate-dependent aminotransferase [Bacillus sp. REN16]|uniref:pyridoxal phosphate-dependent aminotransferase n=1 Tax=Bacillus sp. REN16 TaxID=2887296 RepID=UPI001E3DA3AB|nr:pyridoxal phosphate-dependent aminotransferase [Bacillus sp. REN16]MCC3358358.1 pyridoxal phosphate-dependent aminotransferase [Bacillus sp. REN16]